MTIRKKHIAAAALAIWLAIVTFFMILSHHLNLEIFFVLWLIGILIIVELADPAFSRPDYLHRLRYVIAVGVLLFGTIVAHKVLEILGT
ncbi:hypothetical protein ASZ90_008918 [hydrocarbon metagenome]|uniref:Uncharacterized protein n=1 Tax=hydrocarbon metagenome TaxID=938273 RepID=A0A0W8FK88_9ZZZZ